MWGNLDKHSSPPPVENEAGGPKLREVPYGKQGGLNPVSFFIEPLHDAQRGNPSTWPVSTALYHAISAYVSRSANRVGQQFTVSPPTESGSRTSRMWRRMKGG